VVEASDGQNPLKEQVVRKNVMRIGVTLMTLLSAAAYGQEDKNNEIGFLLGRMMTPSHTAVAALPRGIDIGAGTALQATYARRLRKGGAASLYLEVPFVATPMQKITAGPAANTANYASLFVTPSLRVKLAPDRVLAPWFSVGGGYGLFEESGSVFGPGLPNRAPDDTLTHTGVLQIGGGVDVQPRLKLLFLDIGFRGEVRDFYSGAPDLNVPVRDTRQHNVVVSGGFVIHF
jgi:hypothetical protein